MDTISRAVIDDMLADTRETFDASGPETPQAVRDVIEYVASWLTVALDKPALAALAAPAQHEARQRCIDARNALNAALHGDGAVIDTLEQVVASACAVIKRHAAPAQPNTWREAVLDALTATGSDMPATATPAEIVRAVIDAHVQIALDPRVSDAAPAQHKRAIAGLGRMTDDDGGYVTLQFVDEAAAQAFMENYAPSVDIDDMPPIREDAPAPVGVGTDKPRDTLTTASSPSILHGAIGAKMPCGTMVSNVYEAYEAGKLAAPAQPDGLAEFLQFRAEFRAWRDAQLAALAPQPRVTTEQWNTLAADCRTALVNAGALQIMRNAPQRDAEAGQVAAACAEITSSSVADRNPQPIATAPTDGTPFLAYKPGPSSLGWFSALILNSDDMDCEYDGGVHSAWDHSYVDGVTLWLPNPPAPKEQA